MRGAMLMTLICLALSGCGTFKLAAGGTPPPGKTKDQQTLDVLVCKDRAKTESQTAADQARGFVLGLGLSVIGVAIDYQQQKMTSAGFTKIVWKQGVTRSSPRRIERVGPRKTPRPRFAILGLPHLPGAKRIMSPEQQIRRVAAEAASHKQQHQAHLEREKIELETKLAENKAALDVANLAGNRLANFPVKSGADFLCPYCWINDGKEVALRAVGGGTDTHDNMRCAGCGRNITLSVG